MHFTRETRIDGIDFLVNKYGMLRQKEHLPFDYSKDYLEQQSTNIKMAYLRIGYLLSTVSPCFLSKAETVELGPGSGVFFEYAKDHVKKIAGYDVAESPYATIDLESLHHWKWDILFAFDVLEHFENIDDLWKIDFECGYFSIPAPPKEGVNSKWRHWKPNEHLWYITSEQFCQWVSDNGYEVIQKGCPEDLLRKRWDETQPNINSFIIRKIPEMAFSAMKNKRQ